MKQTEDNLRWCIVVADDHGPEWAPEIVAGSDPAPVQYCRLGESHTLLQKALRRALYVAPASRVMFAAAKLRPPPPRSTIQATASREYETA